MVESCIASIFVGTSNGRFELLVNGRNESTEAWANRQLWVDFSRPRQAEIGRFC